MGRGRLEGKEDRNRYQTSLFLVFNVNILHSKRLPFQKQVLKTNKKDKKQTHLYQAGSKTREKLPIFHVFGHHFLLIVLLLSYQHCYVNIVKLEQWTAVLMWFKSRFSNSEENTDLKIFKKLKSLWLTLELELLSWIDSKVYLNRLIFLFLHNTKTLKQHSA